MEYSTNFFFETFPNSGSFWGPKLAIFGVQVRLKNCFGSTYVVKQLSFSMFCSVWSFDFGIILGLFFLLGAIFGVSVDFKNCFEVYSWS